MARAFVAAALKTGLFRYGKCLILPSTLNARASLFLNAPGISLFSAVMRFRKAFLHVCMLALWSIAQTSAQVHGVYADSARCALVLIETPHGPIKIRLYNQTPKHRDMFVKLASEGFYDSLLFHRVIEGFMIQGGDPDSRKAKPGQRLGDGDVVKWSRFDMDSPLLPFHFIWLPYFDWIEPEFHKDLFHKRGVLAAARESDDKNPRKKSSACQFYITQGRGPLSDRDLQLYEWRINGALRTQIKDSLLNLLANAALKAHYQSYKLRKQNDSLVYVQRVLDSLVAPLYAQLPHYTFSEEQVKVYKQIGGTPHLDGNYTVYGEVIYGMDVVDLIAGSATDKNDRPLTDIRMKVTVLRKPLP